MGDISLEEARKAMIAKRFGGNTNGASTGGGGSVRRKKKGAHKSGGGNKCSIFVFMNLIDYFECSLDDKKLGSVLKKMSMTNINGVEEVNIFKDDGSVIHISQPKSK